MLLCACDRSDQQIKVYRVAKAPLEATPPVDVKRLMNASLSLIRMPGGAPLARS